MKVWTDIKAYSTERFHASASSPHEMPYGADEEQRHLLTASEIEAIERKAFEAAYCYGLGYGKYEGDHGTLEDEQAWNDFKNRKEGK